MGPIKLSESERKKPLSFDPVQKRFLYLADIKAGRIFSPKELNKKTKRILVLKRLEMEEDHSIESIGALDKERQMAEVRNDTDYGKEIVQAWITNLTETIEGITRGEYI